LALPFGAIEKAADLFFAPSVLEWSPLGFRRSSIKDWRLGCGFDNTHNIRDQKL